MTIAEWIALAAPVFLLIAGIWRQAADMGEIKAGVKELLGRAERTDKSVERVDSRVSTLETRVNDHTERIARLEGREEM